MPIQVLDLIAPAQAVRKNAIQSPAGDDGAFGRMVEVEGIEAVGPAPAGAAELPVPPKALVAEAPILEGSTETEEFASSAVDLALLLGVEPLPIAPAVTPVATGDRLPAPVAEAGTAVPAPLAAPDVADTAPVESDDASSGDAPAPAAAEADALLHQKNGGKAEPMPVSVPVGQIATTPAAAIPVAPPQPGEMLRELAALRREGVVEIRGTAKTVEAAATADAEASKPAPDKAGRSFAEIFAAASSGEPAFEGLPGERPPGEPVVLPGSDRAIATDGATRPQAAPTQASTHAAATNVPITALSTEIAARAAKGMTQFEIRLDPPELGKIDVSLKIDGEGQVISRLVVERAETLDLLKSDQRALERALEQAGLRAEQGALQFELRNGNGGNAGREQGDAPRFGASTDEAGDAGAVLQQNEPAGRRGASGVDIRI